MPNETRSIVLPAGYKVRRPTLSDLDPVFAVVDAAAIVEYGASDFSLEDFRSGWQRSDFDLATDAWLVVAPDRQIAAYADVTHRQHGSMDAWVSVHPRHLERGIGTYLMRQTEVRAREHIPLAAPQARVVIQRWLSTANAPLYASPSTRDIGRCVVSCACSPILVTLAPCRSGPTASPCARLSLARMSGLCTTPSRHPFRITGATRLYPSLSGESACSSATISIPRSGSSRSTASRSLALRCRPYIDMGWVDDLGVLRHWRRNGLGLALLRHAFRAFQARGLSKAGLGVDAHSLTGATLLYERAGMRAFRQWDIYEKELRPSTDLTTQSIYHIG